jgi:hypothetical protein
LLSGIMLLGLLVLSGCQNVMTDDVSGNILNISVYSESHLGIHDAVLNIQGNSVSITNTNINAAMEGYEGMEIAAGSLGWIGFDYSPAGAADCSEYHKGYLNFTIKTSSSAQYQAGIASGTNESYIALTAGNNYAADGKWHTISIPVSSFSNIDISHITKYFIFTNISSVSTGDIIYMDDIFWSAKSNTIPVWQMAWADEFSGSSIDTNSNWNYDIQGPGWVNNEVETYTGTNAYISNGYLVIPSYYTGSGYTSGRLKTQYKYSCKYGRIASRIRLDVVGQNAWPAFWMLGDNIDSIGWPSCGEIDIMECGLGGDFTSIGGTAHWSDGSGHAYQGGNAKLKTGTFADDYHIFEVEWSADKLIWKLDGKPYYALSSLSDEFNAPFFIILNLAIGGPSSGYTGNQPVDNTRFPKYMLVDWVRVYQAQ